MTIYPINYRLFPTEAAVIAAACRCWLWGFGTYDDDCVRSKLRFYTPDDVADEVEKLLYDAPFTPDRGLILKEIEALEQALEEALEQSLEDALEESLEQALEGRHHEHHQNRKPRPRQICSDISPITRFFAGNRASERDIYLLKLAVLAKSQQKRNFR